MKHAIRLVSLTIALFTAYPVLAQSAPQAIQVETRAPGQFSAAEAVQLQGTITALDKKNRTAVIKGGGGNEISLVVGDEVKNLDQVAVGDLVTLRYGHALALELRKTSGPGIRKREDSVSATRAQPGSKPAGAVEATISFVADVTAVDPKSQTITLRGVKRTVELKVNDPAQFKLVKVGDQVEGTYSEAVALAITPQARK